MGRGFEDLEVYRQARLLRRRVYKLTTLLPPDEKFGLVPQMRRAAVSLTNCIAEGHGSRSYRHNASYLYRSRGSVCELLNDFNVCEDERYFKKVQLDDIRVQAVHVQKLINGYIKYLKKQPAKDET